MIDILHLLDRATQSADLKGHLASLIFLEKILSNYNGAVFALKSDFPVQNEGVSTTFEDISYAIVKIACNAISARTPGFINGGADVEVIAPISAEEAAIIIRATEVLRATHQFIDLESPKNQLLDIYLKSIICILGNKSVSDQVSPLVLGKFKGVLDSFKSPSEAQSSIFYGATVKILDILEGAMYFSYNLV